MREKLREIKLKLTSQTIPEGQIQQTDLQKDENASEVGTSPKYKRTEHHNKGDYDSLRHTQSCLLFDCEKSILIGCEGFLLFHCYLPCNLLNLRLGL